MKLRPYQVPYSEGVLHQLNIVDRTVLQMPTGAGKTFTVIAIMDKWMQENPNKRVLFVAHRMELVNQFADSCKSLLGIDSYMVSSDVKVHDKKSLITSAMVETIDNRLKADPEWAGKNIGLIVFDESHLNLFDRIVAYFPSDIKVIGVTATPISSNYLKPMNKFYQSIVTDLTTNDVINLGFLCTNKTYVMSSDIDMSKVKKLGGDYNNKQLFNQYKKSKNIINARKSYEQKALNKKTIVFNCNIEHCELVHEEFKRQGYNSRVLYGSHSSDERRNTLKWFQDTPNAVLQNVGVLIAGFDEPTIECVIFNRDTLSLSLWLQATGRGSRITDYKDSFIIIETGSNGERLGDWNYDYDWLNIFHNPAKKIQTRDKNHSTRPCKKCKLVISSALNKCPECGELQHEINNFKDMRKSKLTFLEDFINNKYGESYSHKFS